MAYNTIRAAGFTQKSDFVYFLASPNKPFFLISQINGSDKYEKKMEFDLWRRKLNAPQLLISSHTTKPSTGNVH